MKVQIDYTNWRGKRSLRLITPGTIRWATTPWHPEPQWILGAWDEQKGAFRDFAMKDIHSWRPVQ
jgi:predicted DNA-binding transcriptional regulator YafY